MDQTGWERVECEPVPLFGIVRNGARLTFGTILQEQEYYWRIKDSTHRITFLAEDVRAWLDIRCADILEQLAALGHTFDDVEQARLRSDLYGAMEHRCARIDMGFERITPCPHRAFILAICRKHNCLIDADDDKINESIDEVLKESPKLLEDYLKGKTAVINAIFGKCMAKVGKGKADTTTLRALLEKKLVARNCSTTTASQKLTA